MACAGTVSPHQRTPAAHLYDMLGFSFPIEWWAAGAASYTYVLDFKPTKVMYKLCCIGFEAAIQGLNAKVHIYI